MGAVIKAVGTYSPERILTNDDMAKILSLSGKETSDEWIVTRTGIRKRRVAMEDEDVGTMAIEAAKNGLNRLIDENGKFKGEIPPIDHIILATNTSRIPFANSASYIQKEMQQFGEGIIKRKASMEDLLAGCGGINIALRNADSLIRSGMCKSVAVFGSEKLSSVTDYSDRATCILFGDGASFYLLSGDIENKGFISHRSRGDGFSREYISLRENKEKVNLYDALNAFAKNEPPKRSLGKVLEMDGKEVYKYVVREWRELIEDFGNGFYPEIKEKISFDKIEFISPHLANLRMLSSIDEDYPDFLNKCGLRRDEENEGFCNTSTASQGRRVKEFLRSGNSGEYLLMFGYGAGLISCANLYRKP